VLAAKLLEREQERFDRTASLEMLSEGAPLRIAD
jgi:hypothetical protein